MRRLASYPAPWPARGAAVAVLLAALLIAALFYRLTEPEPAISDAIGYLVAGTRLAEGHGPSFEDANNDFAGPFFMPLAFQVSRPGDARHFLGFPPGFPALLAVGARLNAIHAVVPLLAGLTVATTYFLGLALGASRGASLWAAGILAATAAPLAIRHGRLVGDSGHAGRRGRDGPLRTLPAAGRAGVVMAAGGHRAVLRPLCPLF